MDLLNIIELVNLDFALLGVVSINFYDKFIEYTMEGGIAIDVDDFRVILMTDSHAFDGTDTNKADIVANEIPAGNGYTQGLEPLTSITWIESSGTVTWDADDPTWSASTGPIPTSGLCDDAVIFDEDATVPTADLLVCSIDFDGSQSAGDGTDFIIAFHTNGIFTIA